MSLALESQTELTQFIAETFLISRFHETWTGKPMDFNRRTDDLFGKPVQGEIYLGPLCALGF